MKNYKQIEVIHLNVSKATIKTVDVKLLCNNKLELVGLTSAIIEICLSENKLSN